MRTSIWLLFGLSILLSACTNNVQENAAWARLYQKQHLHGSFMLYNNLTNQFTVYNLKGTQLRRIPGHSFDLMEYMIGLETGILTDTSMRIQVSDSSSRIPADSSLTVGEAFRRSPLVFEKEIASRIGTTNFREWMDSVKYGNMLLKPIMDSFWYDGTLKISLDEQLGLIEQLYFGKLPFQERTQRLVKSMMRQQTDSLYSLSYKSGFDRIGRYRQAWVLGWIEQQNHPYFFAMYAKDSTAEGDFRQRTLTLLHAVLNQQGFFNGSRK